MIFMLIGCSILLALIFLTAFFWANSSGQHDDTCTPAIRILLDEEILPEADKTGDQDHIPAES